MLTRAVFCRAVFGFAATMCTMPSIPAQQGPASTFPFATFDAASESVLSDPHDVVIGPDDRLYVADKFAFAKTADDLQRVAIQDGNPIGEFVGDIKPVIGPDNGI